MELIDKLEELKQSALHGDLNDVDVVENSFDECIELAKKCSIAAKLKTETINRLRLNEQNLDDVYMIVGNKTYSRRSIANEIEKETPFGIETLNTMLMLSLDLIIRQKK